MLRIPPPCRVLPRLCLLALLAGLPDAAALATAPASCPDAGGPTPMVLPGTQAALRAGKALTIIAFGSSSTEGAGASAPDATYPARLAARLRAALPGVALSVLNRGRGGEEVGEMLARLERDVVAEAPTLVIWQAGANAVLRGMPAEAFRAAMASGLARLQAAGADIVLMDNQRAPRIVNNPNHAAFEALMAGLAEDRRLPLFSRARLMRGWEAAGAPPGAFLVEDGLHHNDRGYDCIAAALAESLLAALRPPAAPPAVVAGR